MNYEPFISIIVSSRDINDCARVVESLKKTDFPPEKIELIIVEGNQPSRQRNEGARAAGGEVLFFFDNDCEIAPQLFRNVLKHFADSGTAAVAGVSLVKRDAPPMARASNYVFSSLFGGFTIRLKHMKDGTARPATDKHFIMCNTAIRKDVYLKEGGLNEAIYPGEEDQFFKSLHNKRYRLIYEPESAVWRKSRSTFGEFVKSIFIYGRAKVDQGFRHFSAIDMLFFAPAVFVIYITSIIPAALLKSYVYLIPFALYVLIDLTATFFVIFSAKDRAALRLLYLFPAMHISGGLGEIWGALRALLPTGKKNDIHSKVYIIKKFGEKS
jgi:cellulose synthase/poly-beta-1,6-N-acetylglucosamine synthase-like glycosyltransferase